MAGVWLLAFCSAFALLPYCTLGDGTASLRLSDETNQRLANIEAVLESVLEKNAALERKNLELEQRIESLENENRRLNGDRLSTPTEAEEVNEEAVDDVSSEPQVTVRKPTLFNIQKRASGNKPRALMAGNEPIAFTAVLEKPRVENLGAGQTVVYNHVLTNVGGAYHSTTGVFTVPVSGVYVFNIDTMVESGDSQYLRLMVDGNQILSSFTHGAHETHLMTSSRTTTLRVDAGSEVFVRTFDATWHGNGTIHGNGFSSFSGWIVGLVE